MPLNGTLLKTQVAKPPEGGGGGGWGGATVTSFHRPVHTPGLQVQRAAHAGLDPLGPRVLLGIPEKVGRRAF